MDSAPSPSLDVATPERVSLSLPVAGIGYRCLAYLADLFILFVFWVIAYFTFTLLVSDVIGFFQGLSGLAQTLLVVGVFATQWVYWTAAEVLMDGQTPGKRLVGIRVVRVDGSPVGVLESAVRNLVRVVDSLPLVYAVGVLSVLLTRQHRRLGDLLAGTLLVREERIDLDKYTAPATGSVALPAAAHAERLTSEDVELILSFLTRAPELEPQARARLGTKLVERYGGLDEAGRATVLASPQSTEAFLRARVQTER
ncbi:putative RDD family membrane protein YckC [Archangium gephyra]|uniref:RDD family membrane protein YckC n=1 Tax=Archangium gephyra TaxID=48 RepID=A0AAC8QCG3_9BACT|nr:RDD family protein [Archangium gephyra]AKJ04886.1 RDD family protein [Archangium gephyra]REG37073.1 putative RDD family membrane protein YckC [Archangium gephyra]